MPRYPETRALLEQAIRHVLSEQQKLLTRPDADDLISVITSLGRLAIDTSAQMAAETPRSQSLSQLSKTAEATEKLADELSASLWRPIPVSVGAVYERIEESLIRKSGKPGMVADIRSHYHNLRLRLLQQLLGARGLLLNSDLGEETERIWQHFLEKHLGPMFRVLRGGHVCDHNGNRSQQMDLIVVPSDAHVVIPGDTAGGKAQVLIDQVISVFMVTSNLTVDKMAGDWRALQTIPEYDALEVDYSNLKDHTWPLCYMIATQSDALESLEGAWRMLSSDGPKRLIPQYVVALDSGYLYCGMRKWPSPLYPGNYKTAEDVHSESGIYAGLGLAWVLTQQHGRLAAIRHHSLGAINTVNRYARLLDAAMRREAVSPVQISRFDTMFQMGHIAGLAHWGSVACWAHNGLQLRSLQIRKSEVGHCELYRQGVEPETVKWSDRFEFLRWFRYGTFHLAGDFLAVEEWVDHASKDRHARCIAVFDTSTGQEMGRALAGCLADVTDVDGLRSSLETARRESR